MVSALRATRAAGDAAAQPPVEPPVEPPVIDLHDVHKVYGQGAAAVHAVRGITLRVNRGDYVAVMGASGSGKSTLMHIVGCLDVPSSGRYLLEGIDVGELDESQLALVRNRKVGFVFQSFNLLPRTTTVQNVELPLAYAGVRRPERRHRALAALELVGLREIADRTPRTLSGGQQQRAAVARAIVTNPSLLLADEPTGNLDSAATRELLAVLDRSHAGGGTIVVVTHEHEVAAHARRVVTIRDGRVIYDRVQVPSGSPESPTDEAADS